MYWLLTLRCIKINRSGNNAFESEIWCHAITNETPLSYLHSLEKYKDESYYLINALQITAEEANKYSGELHTE